MILLLVTASAALAPTAFADTSTAELRAKLRSSRQALRAKRARLKLVRADLEAARQLIALYADTPLEDVIDGVVGDESTLTVAPLASDDPATDESAVDDATVDPAVSDAMADATVADDALVDASAADSDLLPVVIVPSADDIAALERRVARLKASARGWRERVEDLARRVRRRERIATWNRRGEWRPLIKLAARRYDVDAGALYRMMMYESGGRRTAGTTYKGLFQYLPSTWEASWNPWRGASIYNGWAQIRATAYAIKRGYGPQHVAVDVPSSLLRQGCGHRSETAGTATGAAPREGRRARRAPGAAEAAPRAPRTPRLGRHGRRAPGAAEAAPRAPRLSHLGRPRCTRRRPRDWSPCGTIGGGRAGVAELVDALDSKFGPREGVWVRVPPPAPALPVDVRCEGQRCASRRRVSRRVTGVLVR